MSVGRSLRASFLVAVLVAAALPAPARAGCDRLDRCRAERDRLAREIEALKSPRPAAPVPSRSAEEKALDEYLAQGGRHRATFTAQYQLGLSHLRATIRALEELARAVQGLTELPSAARAAMAGAVRAVGPRLRGIAAPLYELRLLQLAGVSEEVGAIALRTVDPAAADPGPVATARASSVLEDIELLEGPFAAARDSLAIASSALLQYAKATEELWSKTLPAAELGKYLVDPSHAYLILNALPARRAEVQKRVSGLRAVLKEARKAFNAALAKASLEGPDPAPFVDE